MVDGKGEGGSIGPRSPVLRRSTSAIKLSSVSRAVSAVRRSASWSSMAGAKIGWSTFPPGWSRSACMLICARADPERRSLAAETCSLIFSSAAYWSKTSAAQRAPGPPPGSAVRAGCAGGG